MDKVMTREEQISIASCAYSDFTAGAKWADSNPKLSWRSVEEELPKQDEEVIVLVDEPAPFYKIAFGHIVDKERCKDYNGWHIPNVVYWVPMPSLPQFIKTIIG